MFQIIKKYPEWVSRNPNTTLVSLFVFLSVAGKFHRKSQAVKGVRRGLQGMCQLMQLRFIY